MYNFFKNYYVIIQIKIIHFLNNQEIFKKSKNMFCKNKKKYLNFKKTFL